MFFTWLYLIFDFKHTRAGLLKTLVKFDYWFSLPVLIFDSPVVQILLLDQKTFNQWLANHWLNDLTRGKYPIIRLLLSQFYGYQL